MVQNYIKTSENLVDTLRIELHKLRKMIDGTERVLNLTIPTAQCIS